MDGVLLMRLWGDRSGEQRRRVRQWWGTALLAMLALAGAAHLWLRTGEYGLALTNDSLNYLAAAASAAAGAGLSSADGAPLLLLPPLYPLVLAGISTLGVAPVDAAQLLNIAAFGLTALLAGLWLRRRVRYGLIAAAVTLTAVTTAPLLNAASYLWSETLFVLLIMLSLMQLETYRQRPDETGGRLALAASAVCAGLAAVTRYMGVAAILTGVLLILAMPRLSLRVRLAYAAAYGAAASIPLAAYLARNYALSGSWIVSPNRAVPYTMGDALRDLIGGVLGYGPIGDAAIAGWPGLWWVGAGLAALAALAATAGVLIYRRRVGSGNAGRNDAVSSPGTGLAPALPFAGFAAAYVAILLIVVSDRAAQSIDSRYLMPLVTPLLLVVGLAGDRVMRIEVRGWRAELKWLAIAAAALIGAALLADDVRRGVSETAAALESGYIGDTYNTAQWRNGALPAYLQGYPQAHPIDGAAIDGAAIDGAAIDGAAIDGAALVYTNHAGRLWWFANMEQRKRTVRVPAGEDCAAWLGRVVAQVAQDEIEQDGVVGGGGAYIIWFDRREEYRGWCDAAPDTPPPGLEQLAVFDDGAVYRVRSAH